MDKKYKKLNAEVFDYSTISKFIDKSREQTLNADSFLKVVRKYTDITEHTAKIIGSFVERIDVYKPEKQTIYPLELYWCS